MFYDILEWLSYWTAHWAISSVEWLQRTTQFAGEMFFNAIYVLKQWFAAIRFYCMEYIRYAVDFDGSLIVKLYDLLMTNWEKAKKLWTDWYSRIMYLAVHWYSKISKIVTGWWPRVDYLFREIWSRIDQVFTEWWEWVEKWFTDWVRYLVPLFEEHKAKIIYGLTEGWPKVWWFINDRWVTIFGSIEGHIEGWQTFVDDPAQAIWDWVEPRLQELAADWLKRIW